MNIFIITTLVVVTNEASLKLYELARLLQPCSSISHREAEKMWRMIIYPAGIAVARLGVRKVANLHNYIFVNRRRNFLLSCG